MGTRRSCLALALLLLPAPAWADRHNLEMNAAVSGSSGSQLWGGNFSLARTLYKDKDGFHRWSAFGDLSVQGGVHAGESVGQFSALVGPRFNVWRTLKKLPPPLVPKAPLEYHYRLQFFVQGLTGWVHASSEDHFAGGFGAGVDGLFSDYGGLRGQVDYVHFGGDTGRSHFWRISVGVIYRFEHEHPEPAPPRP